MVGAQSAGPADHRAPGGGRGHRGGAAEHVHPGRRSGALVQHRVLRGQQWRGGGRTVLSLVERDEGSTRQVAVVDVPTESAFTLGVNVEDGVARFWRVDGVGPRTPVGPELDFTRLSDDHGSKLRFTGAMAGIHAVDLVGAAFTADFTGFRLSCGQRSKFRKSGGREDPRSPTSSRLHRVNLG
ncbi:hypothetical protein OG806_37730 [Streptomyces sp. NBC_00882]|uniref:beta-xylosidase family glycoside hydrolase n=1 Tax=Streptomyces sp. NBC_00882 TaxID=2975856 RepID=UPI00386F8916|nr:hypothetical protein OG806_37730 [Streptomyces sp. NBC_00882]